MKAVSYEGTHKMAVTNHPKPKIQSQTDALLRVTTSGICGSDLHMYDGRTPLERGTVVGHEIMGVIEDVGDAVNSIKKGDRVVLPFNIACGFCFNCHRGHTEACLTMNPEAPHAAYGYAGMGPYQGGQAEFVLVPYADFNQRPGARGVGGVGGAAVRSRVPESPAARDAPDTRSRGVAVAEAGHRHILRFASVRLNAPYDPGYGVTPARSGTTDGSAP